jgi:hypothetical protein
MSEDEPPCDEPMVLQGSSLIGLIKHKAAWARVRNGKGAHHGWNTMCHFGAPGRKELAWPLTQSSCPTM